MNWCWKSENQTLPAFVEQRVMRRGAVRQIIGRDDGLR
jgi:hypothetical protein